MTDKHLSGTWNEAERGKDSITTPGTVLVQHEERVFVSKMHGNEWRPIGRSVSYGPVTVGERMTLANLDRDNSKDLNTSAVKSATVDGDEIVVTTMSGSLYKLVLDREAKLPPKKSAVESILAAVGERFLRILKR